METALLQTKFHIPPVRLELVKRPRLIDRINTGLLRKLTLISAPAGFGKTTLASEWVHMLRAVREPPLQVAWFSLDDEDNDPTRFLVYFITALNHIDGVDTSFGKGALSMLQPSQPPSAEAVLTSLINEMTALPFEICLVLDDYHLIEAPPIHDAVTFLLEHLPHQMHLVIATREDPPLPLARLRARGQLIELRAMDLRFSSSEAGEFLNHAMALNLQEEDIATLESRTEGWIAGLQLAAISIQKSRDVTSFIQSFAGSHRYILDYLVEEVLEQQPESIQTFMMQTAILNRLTGSLCDAVHYGSTQIPAGQPAGQQILKMLESANLFIVPLDDERRWYRYHHLFADLLQQRLRQSTSSATGDEMMEITELHHRASVWYEENGFEIDAFQHSVAANDIARAEYLIEGSGVPLIFRGALVPVINWLKSLPTGILDARPSLWVTYAMALLATGQSTSVEQKLQAAEAVLNGLELDDKTRDLIGRIASIRSNVAVGHRQVQTIIAQSRRALEYLHPDNLTYRTDATWQLGVAYEFQGNCTAASQAFTDAISISQASGNIYTQILATTGLANIQLGENQLYLAVETYRRALKLVGDLPVPVGCHIHLCLARIAYAWNDLDAALKHGQQSQQLSEPFKNLYDIFVAGEVFLARIKLAQGDVPGAVALLTKAHLSAHQHNFVHQIPEVATLQVRILLQQGDLPAAAELAQAHELPICQARVQLALEDPSAALSLLQPLCHKAEITGLNDELLKVLVLQAIALHADGKVDKAIKSLNDALELAKPGGNIRIFVDEGTPMAHLLRQALSRGLFPNYIPQLLATFPTAEVPHVNQSGLIEPLSDRELEVLHLIANGLTNPEIAAKLFLSLNTVKVHNRNIFSKLGVHNRIHAITHSQELNLLPHQKS